MNPFFIYLIQVNIALSVFFILYAIVLKKDTFLYLRRFFFLSVVVFSLLYPFFTFSLPDTVENIFHQSTPEADVSVLIGELEMTAVVDEITEPSQNIPWNIVLPLLYIMVTFFFILRLLVQLISIFRIRNKCSIQWISGIPVHQLSEDITPFSFFRLIFIHTQKLSNTELNQILLHEQTHVREMHSLDILLMEGICVMSWWNPILWLMKREMAMNLEYLADHAVLSKGVDSRVYQYHLLRLTYHKTAIQIVNNFNVSQLKQRIMMMNQSKSSTNRLGRYLLIIPLLFLFVTANSIYASQNRADEEQVQIATLGDENIQVHDQGQAGEDNLPDPPPIRTKQEISDEIFTVVENQPEFPGGIGAMMKFLADSIRYPVESQQKGVQGRVICNFVVMKDGSINDVQIVRGVDPLLDAEAVRVLKLMPNWKPGKQRGQEVNVRYTVPIVFKLNKIPPTDAEQQAFKDKMKSFKPANFPGGDKAYYQFLANNVKYPVNAQKNGIQGLVSAVYNIDSKGKVTFVRITKGVDPSLESEVKRVIEQMPDWTPAKHDEGTTSMTSGVNFVFQLEGEDPYNGPVPNNAIFVVGYGVKN